MAIFEALARLDPLPPARPGIYRSLLAVAHRELPKLPELGLFTSVLADAIARVRGEIPGYATRDDVRHAWEWIAGDLGEITASVGFI